MKKKDLLLISFHYPPDIAANPLPTADWMRFLSDEGWRPVVLTRQVVGSSLEELRGQVRIYRVPYVQAQKRLVSWRSRLPNQTRRFKALNFLLLNFFLYPDEKAGWFKKAYTKGISILAKERARMILSTGPPWTNHWIGSKLAEKTGIPWIADYRDPWTQRTSQPMRLKWTLNFLISRMIEKRLLRHAEFCIHASEIWATQLHELLDKTVFPIPNGYDTEGFQGIQKSNSNGPALNLSYVGTLHFPQRLRPFLEGFQQFISSSGIASKDCRLNFVGTGSEHGILKEYRRLQPFFSFFPYVSKKEAVQWMLRSHILVLFLNADTGWYPTKVFEYLASGRRILASPDNGGLTPALIRKTDAGNVLSRPDEIGNWLEHAMAEFRTRGQVNNEPNWDLIHKLSRERQASKLAGLLSSVGE